MAKMILFILTAVTLLHAGRGDSLFAAANAEYDSEEYRAALALYDSAEVYLGRRSALWFNRGNAHYRLGELPRAVLAYERALLCSPGDRDVVKNINFVRGRLRDTQDTIPLSAALRLKEVYYGLLPLPRRLQLLALFSAAFTLFLGLALFKKDHRIWAVYFAGMSLMVCMIFAASAGWDYHEREQTRRAVLLAEKVVARSEPRGGTEIFTVHGGSVLHVADRRGKWIKTALPDGAAGWIEADKLEIIEQF
ncbi:MAG: tetratricopeptide repeat protein [Fibrobacterota bacterium]